MAVGNSQNELRDWMKVVVKLQSDSRTLRSTFETTNDFSRYSVRNRLNKQCHSKHQYPHFFYHQPKKKSLTSHRYFFQLPTF